MSEQGQVSEDGQWQWDAEANDWKPIEGAADTGAEGGAEEGTEQVATVDPDVVANMMDAAEQEASEA